MFFWLIPFVDTLDLPHNLEKIIFVGTPKHWDSYKRALLYLSHEGLQNIMDSHICLACVRQSFLSQYLLQMEKNVLQFKIYFSLVVIDGQVHSLKYNREDGLHIPAGRKFRPRMYNAEQVHLFTGKLFFLSHHNIAPHHAPKLFRRGYFFPNMYTFHLHKYLSLNLTVSYIYISSSIADNCALATFRIIQVENLPDFDFCGVHSLFPIFSTVNKIDIILLTEYFSTQYDIRLYFGVIDSEKIYTIKKANNNESNLEMISFYVKKIFSLHKYHLSISKLDQILVQAHLLSAVYVEAFDGPGALSAPMHNVSSPQDGYMLFSGSTFQCILFVLVNSFNNRGKIQFSSVTKKHAPNLLFVTPQNEIQYEFSLLGSNSWIVVKVSTSEGLKIEGTWNNLNHSGKEGFGTKCQFAGTSLYDFVEKGGTRETFTKCRTMGFSNDDFKQCHWDCTENLLAQHRNFYTKSNVVLLVIYSFQGYYNYFSGNMRLKPTSCKSVLLNICDSRQLIISDFFSKISQGHDECIVMQVFIKSQKVRHRSALGCELDIWLNTKQRAQLSVEVKAWLKSFYPNYHHHKMLLSELVGLRRAECKFTCTDWPS